MADNKVKVEIRGLRELKSAFRQVETALPKRLAAEFKEVAQMVVNLIQPKVPHISGRAAGSIKARGSQRGASIAFGGSAAPYYPWLDFGGRVGRQKATVRPFLKEGRYVYPTIKQHSQEIEKAADDAVAKVAREAGFETRGGEM